MKKIATTRSDMIEFKMVGANALVIDGNASETIDGAPTLTLSTSLQWARLVCDGFAWHRMG